VGGAHRLSKIGVKFQHVVELFLQCSRLQSFVLIVLQKICLQKRGFQTLEKPLEATKAHLGLTQGVFG